MILTPTYGEFFLIYTWFILGSVICARNKSADFPLGPLLAQNVGTICVSLSRLIQLLLPETPAGANKIGQTL